MADLYENRYPKSSEFTALITASYTGGCIGIRTSENKNLVMIEQMIPNMPNCLDMSKYLACAKYIEMI